MMCFTHTARQMLKTPKAAVRVVSVLNAFLKAQFDSPHMRDLVYSHISSTNGVIAARCF